MPSERRLQRIREVLERRQEDLLVVLENVHDPHNASAVVRSCDAFGVGRVGLCYTHTVIPDISKGVAGHVPKWMEFEEYGSYEACTEALRGRGLRIYATQLGEGACDYLDVDWTEPSAIVLGNEHQGCAPELLALADATVMVPMQGMAQSLNVSVAGAVLLAEAARQRQASGRYAPRWSEAKEQMLQHWLQREEPWVDEPGQDPPD